MSHQDPLMLDTRPAVLLLSSPDVLLLEIKGANRSVLDKGVLQVFSMEPSAGDLELLSSQLNVQGERPKEIAFASCNNHRVPLNKSYPCLMMDEHLYVFALPGMMLGIQFADSADVEEIEVFQGILQEHCNFRRKEVKETARSAPVTTVNAEVTASSPEQKKSLSDKVTGGVLAAGALAVKGLQVGSTLLAGAITSGSDKLVEKVPAREQPVQVSDETLQKLKTTRMMSKTAVTISATMAQTAVGVSMLLADQIANHVGKSEHAGKLHDPRLEGAKKVGLAAVGVAAEVLTSVTAATKTILTCTADATAKLVEHRYGTSAGEAAREGLGIVGDGIEVSMNAESMAAKAIAKKVGTQALKKSVG
eukprot:PhF_6_TR8670/c0_g1_i1/m.13562/K19366/SPG20; spartin